MREWDEATFEVALERAEVGIIEAAGFGVSADQLRRLLEAAPEDDERPGRRRVCEANLRGARFSGDAEFAQASFIGNADFADARFSGEASFREASFADGAKFDGASFSGYADFGEASFGEDVSFYRARFGGSVRFYGANFSATASFWGASFGGNADFHRATFSRHVTFLSASFGGDADLRWAFFSDDATFNEAHFGGDARFQNASFSRDARFTEARFIRDAEFFETRFSRSAYFFDATFSGTAYFPEALFGGDAKFQDASFGGYASFDKALFSGDAGFVDASFGELASFDGAQFSGAVSFREASFTENARFNGATFSESASFRGAIFTENASFNGATFGGDADFAWATFGEDGSFDGATFERARHLGPLFVCGTAFLDRAEFTQPVRIQVSSRVVSCSRAVFRGGADVFVRWADMSLEDADFAAPSLVTELPPRRRSDGKRAFLGWEELARDGTWRCPLAAPPDQFAPRVLSLRRAKVGGLTLSGVDMRPCLFVGAHGLDELKLDRAPFAYPPERARWWPVRWTRRQTVAEERQWREGHGYGADWYLEDVQAPKWLADTSQPPDAEQIAGVYRALRKGREDSKDEPGAADFYYGEMEMRRHSGGRHSTQDPPSGRAVVSIIWLYWLVSGYGLRAGRALGGLAITIALGAILLGLFGFDAGKHPDDGTLVFAAESSISLLRAPETENLSTGGHMIQIVLRLAGPLFFGLALLALRGRVKR